VNRQRSVFARVWKRLSALLGTTQPSPRKVIFVSYGVFDCNSAVHIAGFAESLVSKGYRVAVCASGGVDTAYAIDAPSFEFFDIAELTANPDRVLGFDGELSADQTLLYCWTPRPIVRAAIAPILKAYSIPYVVHLEDNELHLAQVLQSTDYNEGDPSWFNTFMDGAIGATIIEPRLREMLPAGLPSLVLEPGVDPDQFSQPLGQFRQQTIRYAIGMRMDTTMVLYPGNVHPANLEEMRPLYEAIQILRQRGRDVFLVRTGTNYVEADFLAAASRENGIISLGQVERPFLVELLKCADLFIQPGKPGPFNDYRLPSKLPEFMAVGRPIILPRSNVGQRLRHGIDAMLLDHGTSDEIVQHADAILADRALAARLAANAKAFAQRQYRWETQGEKLSEFLRAVFAAPRA
jgi:glycosyltransferase involved in cell wall biosynthesis